MLDQSLMEKAFLVSAGGRASGFVAKVISKKDYNHYFVKAVEIGIAGTNPTVMGNQLIAVNAAESFLQQGTIAAGTYVIIFKIGEYFIFYAKP